MDMQPPKFQDSGDDDYMQNIGLSRAWLPQPAVGRALNTVDGRTPGTADALVSWCCSEERCGWPRRVRKRSNDLQAVKHFPPTSSWVHCPAQHQVSIAGYYPSPSSAALPRN